MAPCEPQSWKQLKTSSKAKRPDLFYNYVVLNSSLSLQLTDLVTLWQCSLSKSDIISEAAEQHCSIDPSESADQLNVFLSKLEQSLKAGKTILANAEGMKGESLFLRTQVALPRPLQLLVFTFTLNAGKSAQFTSFILRPALKTISSLESQLASLEDTIKAKDHVIAKLLDRIGNQSVDMSMIFPTLTGAGGRKGSVTVEMAKQRIAGMEPFDHDVWLKGFDEEIGTVAQVGELVRVAENKTEAIVGDDDWTKDLPGPESLGRVNASQTSKRLSQSQSHSRSQRVIPGSDEETASEDEFERQATPPSLKKKKRPSPEAGTRGETSTQSSGAEDNPPPSKKQRTTLIGGIESWKSTAKSNSDGENSSSSVAGKQKVALSQRRKSDTIDATASSNSDSEVNKSSKTQQPLNSKLGGLRSKSKTPESSAPAESPSTSPPPARPASSHASTPSRRLGRLGKGRQRTATAFSAPEEKEASQPATASRRLGRIGVKKAVQAPIPEAKEADSETASEDDDLDAPATKTTGKRKTTSPEATTNPRPRSKQSKTPEITHHTIAPDPEPNPQPVVETGEQKAARKKDELKKKIASGPAKKKRRF